MLANLAKRLRTRSCSQLTLSRDGHYVFFTALYVPTSHPYNKPTVKLVVADVHSPRKTVRCWLTCLLTRL